MRKSIVPLKDKLTALALGVAASLIATAIIYIISKYIHLYEWLNKPNQTIRLFTLISILVIGLILIIVAFFQPYSKTKIPLIQIFCGTTLIFISLFLFFIEPQKMESNFEEWGDFNLLDWEPWGAIGSTLQVRPAGDGVVFSGTVNMQSAGYVIETPNLSLKGKWQIKLIIAGIEGSDTFDHGKLLKLELNDRVVRTQNNKGINRNDPDYLNARNGEYIFDITGLENITKINFVFYNCTVHNLSVMMFTR